MAAASAKEQLAQRKREEKEAQRAAKEAAKAEVERLKAIKRSWKAWAKEIKSKDDVLVWNCLREHGSDIAFLTRGGGLAAALASLWKRVSSV